MRIKRDFKVRLDRIQGRIVRRKTPSTCDKTYEKLVINFRYQKQFYYICFLIKNI